jgi:anti-sigma factor RsiW
MSDRGEIVRLRRAFRSSAAPLKPESCPTPETLWSALRGELPPAEVRRVVDHTALCSACAEDWRLALALEGEQGDEEEEHDARPVLHDGRLLRYRAWLAVPIAAAAMITVAQWGMRRPPAVDPIRGLDQPAAVDSSAPAKLSRRDGILTWPAIRGTVAYEVLVEAGDGALELQKTVQAPRLQLEPGQLAKLPRGTAIRWAVDAVLPDGSRVHLPTFHSILD